MCRIFAGQAPQTYAYQTRSVRLSGHSTSIRLEAAFWNILEEIAAAEHLSLGKLCWSSAARSATSRRCCDAPA